MAAEMGEAPAPGLAAAAVPAMPAWQRPLGRIVEIRPGEGRRVALMFALAMAIGVARSFTTTASIAIFFARYDASALPYTYVGSAMAVAAAGYVYSALETRLGFAKLLAATLVAVAAFLVALRMALAATTAAWPSFAVAVSNEIVLVLSGLVFWGLAARLFNVRQGKRLFGFIGSGMIIAFGIGGVVTPALVSLAGSNELVSASAIALAGALALLLYILGAYRETLSAAEEGTGEAVSSEPQPGARRRSRWRDSYLLVLLAYGALSQMVYYAIDAGFATSADAQYPSTNELAAFLGVFSSATYVLTFLVGAAVVGPLMNRFGVRFQVMISPVSLAAGTAAVLIAGAAGAPPVVIFALVCISKLLIEINWESVYSTVKPVLFQPLPARDRLWSQTMVEGIAEPIAQGVFGIALIAYAAVVPFTGVSLAVAAAPLCIGFIVLGVWLGNGYVRRLGAAVSRRALARSSLAFEDHALRDALRQGLAHPDPGQVLFCLDRLEELHDPRLDALLGELTGHPSPAIRLEAARRIERHHFQDAYGTLVSRFLAEPAQDVRAALLRSAISLEPSQAIHRVAHFLDSEAEADQPMRRAALAALLCYAIGPTHDASLRRLLALADSPVIADRQFAASLAGRVPPLVAIRVLPALLRDAVPAVRLVAIEAATHVNISSLWAPMLANLEPVETRLAALAAVTTAGPGIVTAIRRYLSHEPVTPRIRELLLRACGRVGGPMATDLLWEHLHFPAVRIRTQALRALATCEYQANEEQRRQIGALLAQEATGAAWALGVQTLLDREAFPPEGGEDDRRAALAVALRSALEDELRDARERVFLVSGLCYDRATLASARANAHSRSEETRANAVELLDTLIAQEHKGCFLPLVEDLTTEEQLSQLRKALPEMALPGPAQSLADALAATATLPPETFAAWTCLCAGELLQALRPSAPSAGSSILPAEAAPEGEPAMSEAKSAATSAPVADTGATREAMLSTLERVLLLKRVSLFRRTPDSSLADVAEAMAEVEVAAGDTIMREGEMGDALYVIADGSIALKQGERMVATLGAGDVAGELEALDPEPRSNTATALTDCRLLALHRDLLFELMGERLEVAHGIVEFLIRKYARGLSPTPLAEQEAAPARAAAR